MCNIDFRLIKKMFSAEIYSHLNAAELPGALSRKFMIYVIRTGLPSTWKKRLPRCQQIITVYRWKRRLTLGIAAP